MSSEPPHVCGVADADAASLTTAAPPAARAVSRRPGPWGRAEARHRLRRARADRGPDRDPAMIERSWRVIARTDQCHSTGSTSRRGRLNVATRARVQPALRRPGEPTGASRVYCPSMTAGRISTGATIRMRGRDRA